MARLLVLATAAGLGYAAVVRVLGIAARPELALALAPLPLAALALAAVRRRAGLAAGAVAVLLFVGLLHQYLTLMRAARLDGG